MKLLAGIAVGITLSIIAHILGWPLIGWLFIRIPPANASRLHAPVPVMASRSRGHTVSAQTKQALDEAIARQ